MKEKTIKKNHLDLTGYDMNILNKKYLSKFEEDVFFNDWS